MGLTGSLDDDDVDDDDDDDDTLVIVALSLGRCLLSGALTGGLCRNNKNNNINSIFQLLTQ